MADLDCDISQVEWFVLCLADEPITNDGTVDPGALEVIGQDVPSDFSAVPSDLLAVPSDFFTSATDAEIESCQLPCTLPCPVADVTRPSSPSVPASPDSSITPDTGPTAGLTLPPIVNLWRAELEEAKYRIPIKVGNYDSSTQGPTAITASGNLITPPCRTWARCDYCRSGKSPSGTKWLCRGGKPCARCKKADIDCVFSLAPQTVKLQSGRSTSAGGASEDADEDAGSWSENTFWIDPYGALQYFTTEDRGVICFDAATAEYTYLQPDGLSMIPWPPDPATTAQAEDLAPDVPMGEAEDNEAVERGGTNTEVQTC